jgi:hypothetical protein
MADDKNKGKPVENGAAAATSPAQEAPRGFQRVAALDDCPWFEIAVGNVCHGHVECIAELSTEPPRLYYQVRLHKGCKVRVGKGDEAKVVDAKEGDIINLGETHKTKVLRDKVAARVQAGGDYDVWVSAKNKRKIEGGRTLWLMDVQVKENKAPTTEVKPYTSAASAADEDSPF